VICQYEDALCIWRGTLVELSNTRNCQVQGSWTLNIWMLKSWVSNLQCIKYWNGRVHRDCPTKINSDSSQKNNSIVCQKRIISFSRSFVIKCWQFSTCVGSCLSVVNVIVSRNQHYILHPYLYSKDVLKITYRINGIINKQQFLKHEVMFSIL